eukprot:TRINITY_DN6163_c0_g1_i1.p1 TRINITY_DN6163_c0_g1~~TRINITY_DN6163_c0_g1_i1.p1  ORF type:complete len:235 (+),score=85.78 TRINITY_DN6163_c0_g1_i1:637-1341(+)
MHRFANLSIGKTSNVRSFSTSSKRLEESKTGSTYLAPKPVIKPRWNMTVAKNKILKEENKWSNKVRFAYDDWQCNHAQKLLNESKLISSEGHLTVKEEKHQKHTNLKALNLEKLELMRSEKLKRKERIAVRRKAHEEFQSTIKAEWIRQIIETSHQWEKSPKEAVWGRYLITDNLEDHPKVKRYFDKNVSPHSRKRHPGGVAKLRPEQHLVKEEKQPEEGDEEDEMDEKETQAL